MAPAPATVCSAREAAPVGREAGLGSGNPQEPPAPGSPQRGPGIQIWESRRQVPAMHPRLSGQQAQAEPFHQGSQPYMQETLGEPDQG